MWYRVDYIDGDGVHHTDEEGITKEEAYKASIKLTKSLAKQIDWLTKCLKTIKVNKCE